LASSSSAPVVARRDDRCGGRLTAAWPLPGVRAGSALVCVGDRLLAIQDDAFSAVWIDPATRRTEMLRLRGGGAPLAKSEKPDFESAFVHADRIWVLGSGSRPNRCYLARIDLAQREVPLFNAAPLFGVVAAALGHAPNIEGAVPLADRLRLFHRGAGGARGANYTIDVPLDALGGATPRVLTLTRYELGTLGPIGLSFTDAVAVDASRILFLAVAEDTPDGIADGPVTGATLGLLQDGQARLGPLLEAGGGACRRKVEGVALDPGGKAGWLLTDPDDAARPAELCRVELDLEA
jgi:hypothetical protein